MYSNRNLAPTSLLFLLLFACSSSKTGSSPDAGSHDGGLTIDTKLTVLDSANSTDARDTTASTEAPVRIDASAAIDSIDAPKSTDSKDGATTADTKDGVPTIDGGTSGDGRDGSDGSKPSDAIDSAKASDAHDVASVKDAADSPMAIDTAVVAQDGGGALDSPASNSCENPFEIPLDKPHVDVTITTESESHDFDLPCASGGNDVVLSFNLSQTEMVYADTFGASWNTILAISPTCPLTAPVAYAGMVACNDDACGTAQSQVFAILPNGRHFLVLSGVNGDSGSVTIHFQHAPVANSRNLSLPQGSGTLTGTTSGSPLLSLCEGGGPEDCYWWVSCPDYAGGTLSASTCSGTAFDTVLSLQIPSNDTISCANGDSCGLQELMTAAIPPGAGMHVLAVDGDVRSSAGAYTLTYSRP